MVEMRNVETILEDFTEIEWYLFSLTKLELEKSSVDRLKVASENDIRTWKRITIDKWKDSAPDVLNENVPLALQELCHDFFAEYNEGRSVILKRRQIIMYEINRPGCVLIIGNSFHDDRRRENPLSRKGYCFADLKMMEELWVDVLQCHLFEGKSHIDQTSDQMYRLLMKMSQLERRNYSYFVIIIMTHGTRVPLFDDENNQDYELVDAVLGNDKQPLLKRDIESLFRNDNAINLQNLPKFFIYQSCRGTKINIGVPLEPQIEVVKANAIPAVELVPTSSDILSAHPSHPEYIAFSRENEDPGSWFISAIHTVFMKNAHNMHVVDMLTKVNAKMFKHHGRFWPGRRVSVCVKSMSIFESSLTKDFYLLPLPGINLQNRRRRLSDGGLPRDLTSLFNSMESISMMDEPNLSATDAPHSIDASDAFSMRANLTPIPPVKALFNTLIQHIIIFVLVYFYIFVINRLKQFILHET